MNPRKFVVTGATGHLGRSVVHTLAKQGPVVAMSRSGAVPEPPFGCSPASDVRAVAMDVSTDGCVPILREQLGDDVALIHLAAWHPPRTAGTTAEDRRQLLETNVHGSMRVLEAARREGDEGRVSCVVYASTFEVYGIPEHAGPVEETDRLNPVTDYGATKLSGEDHLLAFAYEERTRCVALRLPAIYGPGELTARALPNFLRAVVAGMVPTIVGEGTDLRDQLHVADAAAAIAQAACGAASGIFNVADGERHSILQLAETAMQVAELDGSPERLPAERPSYDFHMSIERARRELGFTPQVTLRQGMSEELAWLRAGSP